MLHKQTIPKRFAIWKRIMVSFTVFLLFIPIRPVAAESERGIGPCLMVTDQGRFKARLIRRDGDMLWIMRRMQTGKAAQVGVRVSTIQAIALPRPSVANDAPSLEDPEAIDKALGQLDRYTKMLRPYRDIPGMPVDETLMLQGRLLEKTGKWREALAVYKDIMDQSYTSDWTDPARLRAGFCAAELKQYKKAIEYLDPELAPVEDEALLSDVYMTRGKVMAAMDLHQQAIENFLHLVVFHPFVHRNEPRCLEAVLPSYIALEDWNAVGQTYRVLRKNYPDAEETRRAGEFLRPYKDKLDAELLYTVPGEDDII